MSYIAQPSVQEMFFYLVILAGIITIFVTALLSPLILGEIIRRWGE